MNSFNLRKMYDKFITQLHTQFETYNNGNLKYQYLKKMNNTQIFKVCNGVGLVALTYYLIFNKPKPNSNINFQNKYLKDKEDRIVEQYKNFLFKYE